MINELFGEKRYDPGEALQLRNMHVDYTDPGMLAKHGIAMRDSGDWSEAEKDFQLLTELYPQLVFGWQELGVLRRRQNRFEEAKNFLCRAREVAPSDPNVSRHLSYLYVTMGQLDNAITECYRVADDKIKNNLDIYAEFLRYVAMVPEQLAKSFVHDREGSGSFILHSNIADMIESAIDLQRPFSVVRFGDGEGAWLEAPLGDAGRYDRLFELNRREMLNVWFGNEVLYGRPGFMSLPSRMLEVIRNSTIVGIPDIARIQNEYHLASVRGIPSITNIFRVLNNNDSAKKVQNYKQYYCTCDVHLDLHLNGHFPRLLSKDHSVGIISCHPNLGAVLNQTWGTKVSCQILVREEQSFSQVKGVSGVLFAHYPNSFYKILHRLKTESSRAQLWLVAAGFLGKFYCEEIRRSGGVALDIGSVADGWLGKITRPTFNKIDRYQLQADDDFARDFPQVAE